MSRTWLICAALAAVAIATLSSVASAGATTFAPNRFDDPVSGGKSCGPPATPGACSLRGAVEAAGPGDTIDLATGTYVLLQGELVLPEALTIAGDGPGATTIKQTIEARVINAVSGGLSLSGVTITGGLVVAPSGSNASKAGDPGEEGGFDSGAGILAAGKLTLTDVEITGNQIFGGDGGAGGNGVSGAGGAGGRGGAVSGAGLSGGSTVVLTRVSVTDNLAEGGTGGNGGNAGTSGNGGTGGKGGSSLGAGISTGSATVTIVDSVIAGNEARVGAAGDGGDGGTSTGAPGVGGQGEAATGGGFFANGEVRMTNVTFAGNLAQGGIGGDGGDAKNAGSPNGADSGLAFGATGGGASFYNGAEGHFASVTMVGNVATGPTLGTPGAGFGGGSAGTLGFSFPAGGGNVNVSNAALSVRGTIIAAGQASAGKENCSFSAPSTELDSAGHNLESGTECIAIQGGGDLSGTAAGTGPLQDNGGPTQTMALLAGSAATNAGEPSCVDAKGAPLATDQRGAPRLSPCDIGAFEVQPPAPEPPPTPQLTKLRVRPAKLRSGKKAAITFNLNVAAQVRFTLKRWLPGVKVGGKCRRRSAKNPNGKRCVRLVKVKGGPKGFAAKAGFNKRSWRPRGLAPGPYRLLAKPVGGAGKRVAFKVLPRR